MPQVTVPRPRKRIAITVIATLLIIVLISAAAALFLFRAKPMPQPGQAEAAALAAAQKLDATHQYTLEAQVLQDYLKTKPPKQYQYQPMLQLGTLALNRHDYAAALQWYKEAEAITGKVQLQDAAGAGESEAALGNKQAAIAYYKQAVALSDPNNFYGQTDYRALLKSLEASP
ncbi:MAG TPA: hypothetical protein VGH44_03220 [Candidatus Saccharimonadia bacterium]|jgi:flagellar basal body-associated protein FliL